MTPKRIRLLYARKSSECSHFSCNLAENEVKYQEGGKNDKEPNDKMPINCTHAKPLSQHVGNSIRVRAGQYLLILTKYIDIVNIMEFHKFGDKDSQRLGE